MTYWVPAYVDLGRHPKARRLARALDCPLPHAVGHLFYLWWWAMEYAQDGDISSFRDQDIADAAEWAGDAATFARAITAAGFVDNGEKLHDWMDYGGKVLAQRAAHAQRMQRMRGARATHPAERDAHVTRTSTARAEHVRSLEVEIEVERELESEPTVQGYAHDAAGAAAPPEPPTPLRASPKPRKAPEQPSPEGFALLAAICELTNAEPRGDQRRREALHAEDLLRRCAGDADEAVAYVRYRLDRGDSPQLQWAARDYAPGWRKKADMARNGLNGKASVSTANDFAAYALRLRAKGE